MSITSIHYDGPVDAESAFVFAHGAGVGMDSPFMEFFAEQLAKSAVRVARFEFPYMHQSRTSGTKKPPDQADVLCDAFRQAVARLQNPSIFLGGKSMGGRIASMIADEQKAAGLICLGYPFHPVGKPAQTRTAHLKNLQTPALILQGERDSFGLKSEVAQYELSKNINIIWLTDGDHSFKPRKRSGVTELENWQHASESLIDFIRNTRAVS